MKIKLTSRDGNAFTLVEMLVVIFVLAVLAAMILPAFKAAKRKGGPNCMNNIMQIGLSFRLWEEDNDGKYPMQVSMTNSGTMELFSSGSQFSQFAFLNFIAMSNQLSTPKILHCPADTEHISATNFSIGFSDANISYLFGLDAAPNKPQMILSGDDNLAVNDVPARTGILTLWTNSSVTWTAARHKFTGNIGFADGSVQQVTTPGLTLAISNAAPIRIVIP
jgi:prepilin-type N-terminal cleavage/methylation domain-containing protein/prepilin-type processing-associated H-X9-DG protein